MNRKKQIWETAGFETFKAYVGTANATSKRLKATWFSKLFVLKSCTFSTFLTAFSQADDLQTSIGGSTKPSDTGSAIVANLADLTKLGASDTWQQESQNDWRHKSSLADRADHANVCKYAKSKAILQASSVHESEEASQYWGPTMVTDDAKLDLELFQPKKLQ